MSLTVPVAEIVKANRTGLLGSHPSWARVLLSDVATVQNGFAFPSGQFSKGEGVPLLRIRDVLRDHTEATFTGNFDPAYLVETGDLLVGMDGDFNSALWKGSTALLNQRVCRITTDERFFDRKFLAYALPGYLNAINAETSSITVKHLSSRSIQEIPLPLPPLPEQRRIVAEIETQFTRLDAAMAALERARANLKRYRAAVLAAAVSSGNSPVFSEEQQLSGRWARQTGLPPEGQELPALPPGWKWGILGEFLTDIQAGKSFRCEERPPHEGETGVVKVSAVTWGEYDETKSKTCMDPSRLDPSLLIKQGDFLFSRANTIELVGACVIAQKVTIPMMLSDKILRFTYEGIDPRWLLFYLRSAWGRHEIERLATGNQESMRNIGQDRIRRIRIPVAPESETATILEEMERRFSVATALDASIGNNLKRAERMRQSVLRKAFSGKFVSQDPDDEPASVLLCHIRIGRASATQNRRKKLRQSSPEEYALL